MRQKRKLLLIGPSSGSVHLQNYFELIKDLFDDILIITTHPIDYCEHELVDFSFRSPLKIRSQINKIRRVMNKFTPSIIHVHQANTGGYLAVKANNNKYPLVITAWGSDVLVIPNQGRIKRYVVKTALKGADIITVDAIYMADAIRGLGVDKEIILANFGIVLKDKSANKKNIVYSNRLHGDLYRIEEVIKGFSQFVKDFPDWRLVIGATGPNQKSLEEMAANELAGHQYEFIGFVDQETNIQYYQQARIWVSVPKSDGTAISLLEAMGYGCVPVVSDLPANREWIEDDKNGIIVGDNLYTGLCRAKELDQNIVAENNLSLIMKKGTKEVNRKIFEDIYNNILSK